MKFFYNSGESLLTGSFNKKKGPLVGPGGLSYQL